MPPKRPLRRPPGPAVPSRIALHTQELILFGSPTSSTAAPAKRTPSTNRRTSGPSFSTAAPPPPEKVRSSSQRHRAPPTSTSTVASSSSFTAKHCSSPDYEPHAEPYHSVPYPPTPLHGGCVPSPPPPSHSGGRRIVASGASSRVVRLLRDARAAVQDPIRPETPLDTYGALGSGSSAFGSQAANGGVGNTAGSTRQASRNLELRLRRRLPLGGRLAPMPLPPSSSGSVEGHSASSSTTLPQLHNSSQVLLPAAGLSSQIEVRTHSHGGTVSSLVLTGTTSNDAGLDAESFAQLYTAAQQRGEEGLMDCANFLGRLKEWLSTTSAAAPHTLSANATACLQTTLLYFCEYWPTGAALRHAVDNYAALNSDTADATLAGDNTRLSRSITSSVPLNYAEVALLAAAVMLRSYEPSSLLAEPISLHAILAALHTTAECGVAEWIAQESQVLERLMELLQALATMQRTSGISADLAGKYQQWTRWILDIFTCCCEEASLAAAAGAHTSAFDAVAGKGDNNNTNEQDMIRGKGLAEDVTATTTQGQQRAMSASLMSSTASLHRGAQNPASHAGSTSPISLSLMPQGSPLSLLRHGSGGEGSQRRPQQTSLNSLKALTTYLVSLGLLNTLQELSADGLQQQQITTAPSFSPTISLLPVIGALYRCLAQFHVELLRSSGVLYTLVSMLQVGAPNSATVESTARALVKLTFDGESLREMQEMGTTLLDAAAHALLTQLRLHADSTTRASIELLVSRLCGVVARVAEGSAALQEYLATPAMTHVLEVLAQRYLTMEDSTDDKLDNSNPSPLPSSPTLQAIVWVLGIAAMSPTCSLHLVESVTPLLVSLLQRLRELPTMQTTAVYVLMCLSNLSYFFNRFELLSDTVRVNGEGEVAVHAEWLSTICSALCFSLAAYLFEDNVEATVEATRILGNISYTNTGRDWVEENRCDEVVVLFLGHEDLRIVYNCCGILLNLTAASPCRVVEDPELLQLMLSYTARYTRDETIESAVALERERLRKELLLTSKGNSVGEGAAQAEQACAAEANSSANQIADLVEKLLLNVKGLLALTALTTGSEDI